MGRRGSASRAVFIERLGWREPSGSLGEVGVSLKDTLRAVGVVGRRSTTGARGMWEAGES